MHESVTIEDNGEGKSHYDEIAENPIGDDKYNQETKRVDGEETLAGMVQPNYSDIEVPNKSMVLLGKNKSTKELNAGLAKEDKEGM